MSISEHIRSNHTPTFEQGSQPKITWSQPRLEITLSPGESQTITVSFTSTLSMGNLAVEAVPEIARFISISPFAFPHIQAAQQSTLNLVIAVSPETAPGRVEGTIHVRSGSQTLAQTLKVVINVWANSEIIDGITIKTPPNWFIGTDGDLVTISNVASPSELSDAALQSESFFHIRKLRDANPGSIPVEQWFDQYFSDGFPVELTSRSQGYVDGHAATFVETSEIGGKHRHVYIFEGPDVLEVSYGLFASAFNAEYNIMLSSIDIPN